MKRGVQDVAGERLKVLVLTPDFPPGRGGIQHLVARLTQSFDRSQVDVVTVDAEGEASEIAGAWTRVTRVPRLEVRGRRFGVAVANLVAVGRALRERPDVVLVAHIVNVPAARAIKRLTGAPYVLYVHCDEIVHKPSLASSGARGARRVVAVSNHTREECIRIGAPAGPITVIPPGVDFADDRAAQDDVGHARPTIVTVARLADRYKGHDVMIDAIDRVRVDVPEIRWVVVGDGPLRAELQRAVASRGLSGNVEFVGEVSDAERDRWLDRADVFAMPSRVPPEGGGEGFGIVFAEASAHGLPVVAGAEGGALDAVLDDETGLLVDPRDASQIADALVRILTDDQLRARLGNGGREFARTLRWPLIGRAVEDVLFSAAGREPVAA